MEETLGEGSIICGVQRINREQALTYTTGHPICAVSGIIHDTALALDIDPAFALAEAILESGWGRSNFAQNRHNWYGYEAYFQRPDAARTFASDEEGIRVALEAMASQYFSPGGAYYAGGAGKTLGGWAKE